MKKGFQFLIALFVLAGFVLVACSHTSSSLEGKWSLVSYGDPLELTPAIVDVETFIEFKEGQMSGNAGCNGFGGEYSVDGDQIKFGPIMSTMMFCEGPVGEQEMGTLAVFQESEKFVLDGDTLTIESADASLSIVLERK